MWFFEVKYGNNCAVGGHFYSREEMFEWFDSHLAYYTFEDNFYDLHIWETKEEEE
jgi:hypothetical protein